VSSDELVALLHKKGGIALRVAFSDMGLAIDGHKVVGSVLCVREAVAFYGLKRVLHIAGGCAGVWASCPRCLHGVRVCTCRPARLKRTHSTTPTLQCSTAQHTRIITSECGWCVLLPPPPCTHKRARAHTHTHTDLLSDPTTLTAASLHYLGNMGVQRAFEAFARLRTAFGPGSGKPQHAEVEGFIRTHGGADPFGARAARAACAVCAVRVRCVCGACAVRVRCVCGVCAVRVRCVCGVCSVCVLRGLCSLRGRWHCTPAPRVLPATPPTPPRRASSTAGAMMAALNASALQFCLHDKGVYVAQTAAVACSNRELVAFANVGRCAGHAARARHAWHAAERPAPPLPRQACHEQALTGRTHAPAAARTHSPAPRSMPPAPAAPRRTPQAVFPLSLSVCRDPRGVFVLLTLLDLFSQRIWQDADTCEPALQVRAWHRGATAAAAHGASTAGRPTTAGPEDSRGTRRTVRAAVPAHASTAACARDASARTGRRPAVQPLPRERHAAGVQRHARAVR
jgi:hypothetical protein